MTVQIAECGKEALADHDRFQQIQPPGFQDRVQRLSWHIMLNQQKVPILAADMQHRSERRALQSLQMGRFILETHQGPGVNSVGPDNLDDDLLAIVQIGSQKGPDSLRFAQAVAQLETGADDLIFVAFRRRVAFPLRRHDNE